MKVMVRFHLLKKLQRNKDGVAALEFALLAPLFFAVVFAICELLLFMLAQIWLDNGLQRVGEMMAEKRNEGVGFTVTNIRDELCLETFGIGLVSGNCDDNRMRVGAFYSGRLKGKETTYPDSITLDLPKDYITPNIDTKWGDVWTVVIKLEWPFYLPTTKLIQMNFASAKDVPETRPMLVALRTLVVPRKLVARPAKDSSTWE